MTLGSGGAVGASTLAIRKRQIQGAHRPQEAKRLHSHLYVCVPAAPCRSHGVIQGFNCDHDGHGSKAGKLGVNCGWSIKYEDSIEGWVLVGYQNGHTVRATLGPDGKPLMAHELEQSQEALRARSTGRPGIPPDFYPMGELMAKSGMSAVHIKDVLDTKGREEGWDLNHWNYQDVRAAFPTSVGNRDFDAVGLVELLQQRATELGMMYFAQTDESGFVKRVFAQLDDSISEWARTGEANIVLFDPTHGTNRYGMKLCCFTTVGPTGQTVILAIALISYEDTNDIEWALRCFAKVFKTAPLAFYSDSGASIHSAFERVSAEGDVWQGTRHMLCVYHLSKNFYSHLRSLFVTKPEVWKEAHNKFWALAKNSDATFARSARDRAACGRGWSEMLGEELDLVDVQQKLCDDDDMREWKDFDPSWKELYDLVEREAVGSTKEAGLRFLDNLKASKHKWAACFTWAKSTWGVNSTQRAEAIHSAIKRSKALANFSLVDLVTRLVCYNAEVRDRRAVDEVRRRLAQIPNAGSAPVWIQSVGSREHPKITPYANELLLAQTSQALLYKFTATGYTSHRCEVYEVKREDDMLCEDCESHIVYDEDGRVQFDNDDEDFGLSRSRYNSVRLTTVNDCSCQLHKALRIPCRHIIGLRITLQGGGERAMPILELIGSKWHHLSSADVSMAVRRLLRRPTVTTQALPEAARSMSRQDRYNLLLHEMTSVAELGAESNEAMEKILAGIPLLTLRLDACAPAPAPPVAASAASGPAEVDESVPKEMNDHKHLMTALGQRFELDSRRPSTAELEGLSTEGATLVGRFFAFKQEGKNRGKWLVGQIIAQIHEEVDTMENGEPDPDFIPWNFTVKYIDYLEEEEELLEYHQHIGYPELKGNADIGRWTLLKEKGLGHDVETMARDGNLHNPQAHRTRGRKEQNRKAPPFGPMAKRKRASAGAAASAE